MPGSREDEDGHGVARLILLICPVEDQRAQSGSHRSAELSMCSTDTHGDASFFPACNRAGAVGACDACHPDSKLVLGVEIE